MNQTRRKMLKLAGLALAAGAVPGQALAAPAPQRISVEEFARCVDPVDGLANAVRGTSGASMEAVLGRFVPGADTTYIREAAYAMVHEELRKGAPKKPGLDDLLEYLHDCAIPLAVASSNTKEAIRNNLVNGHIDQYFDVLLSGEALGRGKPDPLIFLETAKLLGTDPSRTICSPQP